VSPATHGRSALVVAALAAGGIVAALMQTLVIPLIVELPRILHTSPSNASWVITVTLLVSAVASLVASLLRLFVGLLFLGWADHLLGGVLGLLQAMLAAAALLLGMATFPLPAWSEALQNSTLAEPLLRVGGVFTPILPELFQGAIRTALGW